MIKTYPAIFHEEDGGYWIEFPEFQGGAEGDTLEEAMKEASDFLSGMIAYYIDEGIDLPKASNIHNLNVDNGFVSMVQADATPFIRGNKAIRKNVTVPEWISIRADKAGINYSEILTNALLDKLQIR
ncbi:antitoxin HicB [Enterococcus sp. JM4C]|uniref:type II toxin-antitoxin system HicB family antitoxin n=1 Tax=Candidatus Enterococcus huntleyi TaxID=1857217 RepID=UPI00137952A5|nr:type II toxin-antitoxin system HicB family antitoxin [Enterococcus sp. JM4C]KAF1296161.1 antitoxin HicB [Enterococcus sp. JM4C]